MRAGGAVPAAADAGAGVTAETAAAVRRAEPHRENTQSHHDRLASEDLNVGFLFT